MNKIVQDSSKKPSGNGGPVQYTANSPNNTSEIEDVVPTREK